MPTRKFLLTVRLKNDAPRISEGIVAEYAITVPGRDTVGHEATAQMQAAALLNAKRDIADKLLEFEWEEVTDEHGTEVKE